MSDVKININGASLRPMLEEHFCEMLHEIAGKLSAGVLLDVRSDWQPIETAPRDGTAILALEVDGLNLSYAVVTWEGGPELEYGSWRDSEDTGAAGLCVFEPQHWMPLPEPPGEGEG